MEVQTAVDLFKTLARGGFPKAAHQLWHEHFESMLRSWPSNSADAMLDEMGEMSRWARKSPNEFPNEACTHAIRAAWTFIFGCSKLLYARYSLHGEEECALCRKRLMRALGDPDGEILGRAMLLHLITNGQPVVSDPFFDPDHDDDSAFDFPCAN